MKNNLIVPLVIGVIAIAGAAFYGGMQYQKSRQPSSNRGSFAAGGQNGQRTFGGNVAGGARQGANGVQITSGEVVSVSDGSMTIQLAGDQGSKIVLLAPSTTVGKMTDGSVEDLSEGTSVMVTGSANSDGSITANSVQIRPEGDQEFPGMGRFTPPGEGEQMEENAQ